jgi:sarcosine oxidase subunit gamma
MVENSNIAQRIHVLAKARGTDSASVRVKPMDGASRFSLRLRGQIPAYLDLPINSCTEVNGLIVARLGPDEWLLLGADDSAIQHRLSETLAEQTHSLVDIGHRQTAIEVSGLRAREVLNGGCPLDLGDEAFPAGSATRTLLGKAEIILIRTCAEPSYRVECWRSFAPYVYGLLTEVASGFTSN